MAPSMYFEDSFASGGYGAGWVPSRQYLGVKASVVRRYDERGSSGAGERDSGAATESGETFVLGFEDADLGQDAIGVVSLRSGDDLAAGGGSGGSGGEAAAPALKWQRTWALEGKVTCLEVSETEIWAGSVTGDVCRIGRAGGDGGGAGGTDMDVDSAEDDDSAYRCDRVHRGVVSSVGVNAETGQVLSAGYDGKIFFHRLDSAEKVLHHDSGSGATSFSCGTWLSGTTFVTGSLGEQGALLTWDARAKGRAGPALSLRSEVTGGYLCVDKVPTRPHLCVCGHEGHVSLWDLRSGKDPFQTYAVGKSHMVWEVRGVRPEGDREVHALFCDSAGVLGLTGASHGDGDGDGDGPKDSTREGEGFTCIHQEPSGVTSFDHLRQRGSVVCVTEEEGLVRVTENQETGYGGFI